MISIDPIRAAVAPYALAIKVGLVFVLACAMFIGGCNHGQANLADEVAAHKATKHAHAAVLADLADKTRAAANKARAASEAARNERKSADKRFEDAKDEAAAARRDLARALRRGAVQLRPEFTCDPARPTEGQAGSAAGGQDGSTGLREAREGAILDSIGDADHADRWIGWLQSELTSTRKACTP